MELIYLDSNVFLDFWEDRVDNIRPLGEFAFLVLRRTFECEFKILISDWLLKELDYNDLTSEKLGDLIDRLKSLDKLELVKSTGSDFDRARRMAEDVGSHWHDCLHAILASKGGAKYLVTRNVRDFRPLDFIQAVLPEEL